MSWKIRLSPYHKIFYIEWELNPKSAYYNILSDQIIYGDLDINRLNIAIRRYINEHVLLNSHICVINNEPYWVKNSTIKDLEYLSSPIADREILEFVNKHFDLHKDTLYRFKLIHIDKNKYRFIIVLHHLLTDALSLNSVMQSISNYYNSENYTTKYDINTQIKLISDTTDFLYKKNEDNKNKYNLFWGDILKNSESIDLQFLNFNEKRTDKSLPFQYNLTKKIKFSFSGKITQKLLRLKKKYLVTPYFYGQVIFALLLHKYTSQEKIILGAPVAIKEGVNFIYGAQVNTCLIPHQINNETTILNAFEQHREFLKKLKSEQHSYYPIYEILSENNNNKHLLNVMFNQATFKVQPFDLDGTENIQVLDSFNMHLHKFILFEQELENNILYYQIRFDNNIVSKKLLGNFIKNYKRIFVEVLADIESGLTSKKIKNYSLLSDKEYNEIKNKLSNHQKSYTCNQIHKLFENQVIKTPDKLAIRFGNIAVSYDVLNQRSNQLAYHLISKYQIKPESLIALYMNRSEHIIISILAILKAGGAYLPLDVAYSKETLEHILKEANIELVLTNTSNKNILENITINKFCNQLLNLEVIDSKMTQEVLDKYQATNLNIAGDLAYVMYTSGTTSYPKGVIMQHKSCVNRILEMIAISGIDSDDIVLFKTNYVFDVSFSDIFTSLLTGACIIITKEVFDIVEISNEITNNSVTVCHFTPSQFDTLQSICGVRFLSKLKIINFSGEPLESNLLINLDKNVKCINYYGPTETGEVTAEIISQNLMRDNITTIGKNFNNVQLFILDNNLIHVPYGVIGELFIGGVCIAKGYINQLELNQKNFIGNPFQTKDERKLNINSKIYKTGDLVRLLPNNSIEYIGRNDTQIKINGCRVELSGVENKILEYQDIKQVVVQPVNSSSLKNCYLVAYYVSDCEIDIVRMKTSLSETLSENLMPKEFIRLKNIPLTLNGKLDKYSLPKPSNIICNEYVAPQSKLEKRICNIYAEVLLLEKHLIGIKHDFFSIGGNSLLAIKLVAKLQEELHVTINDIFRLRTPENIIQLSLPIKNNLFEKIDQIEQIYNKFNYINNDIICTNQYLLAKYNAYLKNISNNIFIQQKKPIKHVLLTGSTGYLGCNILQKLLIETEYVIYLLVRAESEDKTYERVNDKFLFYFGISINTYGNRIIVLHSNLYKCKLGISNYNYRNLIDNVDSIIHCAALVKHYGEYSEFYQSNILATTNLLELAKLTKNKDFHYISTMGVLMGGNINNTDYYIINENDRLDYLNYSCNSHYYIKSKYETELIVLRYRKYGIKTNIYRIGNIGMHSTNYSFQSNAQDSLFFNSLKAMIDLKIIPNEINELEISPVDTVATSIVKIFEQVGLSNKIYHIFNPNLCDLSKVLPKIFHDLPIKKSSLKDFITIILRKISIEKSYQTNFLVLYQLWIHETNSTRTTRIIACQELTNSILENLGVSWAKITDSMLEKMLKSATN